jgi:hypothetical protein
VEDEDGIPVANDTESKRFSQREQDLWKQLWSTPQAWAWAQPSERWRHTDVALYCRMLTRCEHADASAALFSQLTKLADRIGLSTNGLANLGWQIAEATKTETKTETEGKAVQGGARERLILVK